MMKGREENKIKIDEKIKEGLKDQPQILMEYFAYLSNNGRDSAPSRLVFINSAKRFCAWLKDNGFNVNRKNVFNSVTPGDINRFFLEIGEGLKQKTKADYYVNIKLFFTFLYNMEYIKNNPFDGNKIPKQKYSQKENIVYLTKDEIVKVKNYIREYEDEEYKLVYETIFTLAYKTGIRITALTEINISDINIEDESIEVTDKENYTRDVFPGKNTMELIKEYLKWRKSLTIDSDALFVGRKTPCDKYSRISYTRIHNMLKRAGKYIGKNITPHKLRDTCAMLVYEDTHDIYLTGEVLGHKQINNTRKYAKVTEQRRRETANFLDNI